MDRLARKYYIQECEQRWSKMLSTEKQKYEYMAVQHELPFLRKCFGGIIEGYFSCPDASWDKASEKLKTLITYLLTGDSIPDYLVKYSSSPNLWLNVGCIRHFDSFIEACRRDKLGYIYWLGHINHGLSRDMMKCGFEQACLHNSVQVATWLHKQSYNIGLEYMTFQKLFTHCCEHNYVEIVKILSYYYVPQDEHAIELFINACKNGSVELVKLLLEYIDTDDLSYDNRLSIALYAIEHIDLWLEICEQLTFEDSIIELILQIGCTGDNLTLVQSIVKKYPHLNKLSLGCETETYKWYQQQ